MFAPLNYCAHIRAYLKRSDLEDDDVWKLFRELFSCYFDSCTNGTDDGLDLDSNGLYIFTIQNLVSSLLSYHVSDNENGDNVTDDGAN